MVLAEGTGDRHYLKSCAVGFSGVIFALKVLQTHYADQGGHQSFMGIPIPVPSKYAFWVELIIIHFVSRNASFVGHLAGILVGLAYTKGPLKNIIETLEYLITGSNHGGSSGSEYRSYSRRDNMGRYASFTDGMSEEDQIRRATEDSMRSSRNRFAGFASSTGYGANPSAPPYRRAYPDLNS